MNKECEICNTRFTVSLGRKERFCSRICYDKSRVRNKWYKVSTLEGKTDYVHRMLAEKALGKPLPVGAEVHHVNGGYDGPIVLCENREYHKLLHIRTDAYNATGDVRKRRCDICKEWDDTEFMYKFPSTVQYRHRGCHAIKVSEWKKKKRISIQR